MSKVESTGGHPGPRYRVGIDIGGTFTDLAVLDCDTGETLGVKTPTVPADQSRGVAAGLELLQAAGVDLAAVDYCAHGTTVGLNTILQRSGAHTGLLTTAGFRDVLEIGRLRLPIPWDFYSRRAEPLVPRALVLEVAERIRPDGSVSTPLEPAEIDRVVDAVLALELDALAITLLHSYANPEHEHALAAAFAVRAPSLLVSCSADIWPEMREYERALVTVFNAYVQPVLGRYLGRIEGVARDFGLPATPYVTRSNGGVMTLAAARTECVSTLLSGPAAGVIGATDVAAGAGFENLVTFDMGGTSADVAIVGGGAIALSREEHLGDFPIIMPAIGISSIGMGGGSLAWLDAAGVLKVGPESAGADPGPACYGLGGTRPAIADAFVLCGYLNPERFAGGGGLDVGAAQAAFQTIASELGLTVIEAADAAIQVAVASMYAELSGVLDRRGVDPRDLVLVAFGGAGPVLACQLCAAANIDTVLVPPSPGTLSASGALKASIRSEFVRSHRVRLEAVEGRALRTAFEEPLTRAAARLEREAPPVAGTRFLLSTNLRVSAVGELPAVGSARGRRRAPGEHGGTREIRSDGKTWTARVLWRDALGDGDTFEGPVVLEQPDTTTVVPPGWDGRADAAGNVILNRR
jgi:N-methylhydantoinase A